MASLQSVHFIGILYTGCMCLWLYLTAVFVTMPVFYEEASPFYYGLAQCLAVFIVFNIVLNLTLVRICDSFYTASSKSGEDGSLMDSRWVNCTHCSRMAPPRSHHCSACQRCVLKRDHHCFMTGTCIGLRNQRYFLVYLLYCDVGILYSSYMACYYIYARYHISPLSTSFYHFIPPVAFVECLFGYSSGDFLNVSLLLSASFSTVVGTLFLAAVQIFMILTGTTGYEFKKGVRRYNRGVYQNIKDALGPYWLLHFFIPLPYFTDVGWRNTKLV